MQKNPFDQSTLDTGNVTSNADFSSLDGSEDSSLEYSGNAIEVRYPDSTRVFIPGVVALSGVILSIVLFFRLQPPLNLMLAAIVAIMEFASATFLYFLFNTTSVRADDVGITKSQFGKAQSVRWEEIMSMGAMQVGNGPVQMEFKNASDKVIFRCGTLGNKVDGEKLWDFIDHKLER